MRYLLDTHLLLWMLIEPAEVPAAMRRIVEDTSNRIWFSAASIWEIAIKHSLGKWEVKVEPATIRQSARDTGLEELAITAEHAIGVNALPWLHRDPFDRLLVSQAQVEGMQLLTVDAKVNAYFAQRRPRR